MGPLASEMVVAVEPPRPDSDEVHRAVYNAPAHHAVAVAGRQVVEPVRDTPLGRPSPGISEANRTEVPGTITVVVLPPED